MEDSYKLVGSPVGSYGTYSFYKALKITRNGKERIVAIGDFFFVRLWQDSELMAIGELQLVWTDRGAGRNLASLRLYFLPENTPAGRAHHGEDEVVGISERVVVRIEELLSWICDGKGWRWGLRAAWSGDCSPATLATSSIPAPPPLTPSTKLDFADVEKEKELILDPEDAGVVVFSYPRYCRYRAMVRRLDGIAEHWLHDPLVAALGGYSAPTKNTRILYCRETFEYPELEGHEFVCNHMAPRLRGRAARGRRRRARSASRSSGSDSSASHNRASTPLSVKPGSRNSAPSPAPSHSSGTATSTSMSAASKTEERMFMQRLRLFHRSNTSSMAKFSSLNTKELNLRQLYTIVIKEGGYARVNQNQGWKKVLEELGSSSSSSHATLARKHYEKLLLSFELFEKRMAEAGSDTSPEKFDKKRTIATIDISDSPVRDTFRGSRNEGSVPRLRTPPLMKTNSKRGPSDYLLLNNGKKRSRRDSGDSLKKTKGHHRNGRAEEPEHNFDPSNILNLNIGLPNEENVQSDDSAIDYVKVAKSAVDLNQEFLDSLPEAEPAETMAPSPQSTPKRTTISVVPAEKLMASADTTPPPTQAINGNSALALLAATDKVRPRPSSLRSVRVKPDRRQGASSGSSPPADAISLAHQRTPTMSATSVDDDIIEVPYKPKSPEIIDLDLYESPDSPQSAKRKKLEILKSGGLEVTAVQKAWLGLDPASFHHPHRQPSIWNRPQLLPFYEAHALLTNEGYTPPKVTQGKSIYGSPSPEKTVYGNPKDPFMPPPHVLQGITPRKMTCPRRATPGADVLDLTVKPAVEIVRVPKISEQGQNLSAKRPPPPPVNNVNNNEPRQINPALEITLVAKNKPPRTPQKRSSTGKFMSNKSQSYMEPIVPGSPSPKQQVAIQKNPNHNVSANLVIPNFQVSSSSSSLSIVNNASPVTSNPLSSTSIPPNFFQGTGGTLLQMAASSSPKPPTVGLPLPPLPPLPTLFDNPYVNAFYGSLTGQLMPSGLSERQKLSHMYNTILNKYPVMSPLPPGGVIATTPTSKS